MDRTLFYIDRTSILCDLVRTSATEDERALFCKTLREYLDYLCDVPLGKPLASTRFELLATDLAIELRQWLRDGAVWDCVWLWLISLIRRIRCSPSAKVAFGVRILNGLFEVPLFVRRDSANFRCEAALLRLIDERETAWAVINGYSDWIYDAPPAYKDRIGCPRGDNALAILSAERECQIILNALRNDVDVLNSHLAQEEAIPLCVDWNLVEQWAMVEITS